MPKEQKSDVIYSIPCNDCNQELELGPINRLRYRQSITINNNRIIENNNTAYLCYAVLKFF